MGTMRSSPVLTVSMISEPSALNARYCPSGDRKGVLLLLVKLLTASAGVETLPFASSSAL